MSRKIFQPTEVKSLNKIADGVATAKAMVIYSQDYPVVDSSHSKVMLTHDFIKEIGDRFNKDHRGILGMGKRFPKVIMEHNYKVDEVVGRINSPMSIVSVEIDGTARTALMCDVLLSEPEIISRIEKNMLSGLSAGIYFDKNNKPYLKELTLTSNPALKKAVLLSKDKGEYFFSATPLIESLLDIEEKVIKLEEMNEAHSEKTDERLKIANDLLDRENKIRSVLLSQVKKNKLIRKDVDYLINRCNSVNPKELETIFSKVAPLKLNRGVNFKPQQTVKS